MWDIWVAIRARDCSGCKSSTTRIWITISVCSMIKCPNNAVAASIWDFECAYWC